MRTVGILTVLAVALVVSAAAGILVGAVAIGPSDVFAALFGSNDVNVTILLSSSDRRALQLRAVLGWLQGGVSVISWPELGVAALVVALGLGFAVVLAHRVDAYAFGEETAATLGVDPDRTTTTVLGATALLSGAAVALAGLVGFVGLVIPHALRFVIGATHRRLVPASFLAGATALVLADLGARTIIAPAELPLGAITGLIGAPFFLALLVRSRRVVV